MNRYRVLLPLTVHLPSGTYEQGDEFEHAFTDEDETKNLASGLLEIVPRTYRVVGGSEVDGHQPGETFDAAIPQGRELLLYAGGHIARVEEPASDSSSDDEPIADDSVDVPEPTEPEE